jgi:hypothetical protein
VKLTLGEGLSSHPFLMLDESIDHRNDLHLSCQLPYCDKLLTIEEKHTSDIEESRSTEDISDLLILM